jgi:hypothetical protein
MRRRMLVLVIELRFKLYFFCLKLIRQPTNPPWRKT